MSWEPDRLDATTVAGLRLEEELRSGRRAVPGAFINASLHEVIRPLNIRTQNILALPHAHAKHGMLVVPMLTPGPHDVSFVLSERAGRLRDVLESLGHWDMPTAVFVLTGTLSCHFVVTIDGFRFSHDQRISASHLTVIPPREDREIVVERNSVLLLASPGRVLESGEGAARLDFGEYCGHLKLDSPSLAPTVWRKLQHQDTFGNSITFSQHPCGGEIVAPGGAMSIAVHEDGEPIEAERAPDLLLVAPHVLEQTPSTRWSMDIVMA